MGQIKLNFVGFWRFKGFNDEPMCTRWYYSAVRQRYWSSCDHSVVGMCLHRLNLAMPGTPRSPGLGATQHGYLRGPADGRTHAGSLGMHSELPLADCFVCAKHALGDAAPGGVLCEDALVYAGHAYPLAETTLAYRGYLVAEPMRQSRDWAT